MVPDDTPDPPPGPRRAPVAAVGVAGLVLVAALLPAFGAQAPGADLGDLGGPDAPDAGEVPDGIWEFVSDLDWSGEWDRPDGQDDRDVAGDPDAPDGGVDPTNLPVEVLERLLELFEPGDGGEPDPGDAGEPAPPTGDGSGPDLPAGLLEWLLELLRPGDVDLSGRGYEILLLDEPTPGREVRVVVLQDGEPAPGVDVFFNGEHVGRTGADGMVTGTVPYAEELRISIRPTRVRGRPVGDSRQAAGVDARPAGVDARPAGVDARPAGVDARPAAIGAPGGQHLVGGAVGLGLPGVASVGAPGVAAALQEEPGPNRTIPLGNVEVAVRGVVDPGAEVTLVATVDGNPVPGLYVALDGEPVGQTDDAGRLRVALPRAQETTLAVERGELSAERTLTLANLSVAVEGPAFGAVLPGRPATVSVADDGEPVAGADVRVAGDRVGETGADGTLAFAVPVRPVATVAVTTPDGVRVTRTTAPALPVLVAVVLAAALARAGRTVHRRAAESDRGWLAVVAAGVRATLARGLSVLVTLAAGVEAVARRLASWLRAGHGWLRGGFGSLRGRLTVRGIVGWLRALHRRLLGLPARLRAALRSGDAGPGDAPGLPGLPGAPPAGGDAEAAARALIRAAWREVLARAPVGDHRTQTIAELAHRATAAGLPAGPVETLAEAFREVEYGGRAPSDWRERVRAAAAAVRDADPDAAPDGGERP